MLPRSLAGNADAPAHTSGVATPATLVSMFQTTALRSGPSVNRSLAQAARSSVVYLTGVSWGAKSIPPDANTDTGRRLTLARRPLPFCKGMTWQPSTTALYHWRRQHSLGHGRTVDNFRGPESSCRTGGPGARHHPGFGRGLNYYDLFDFGTAPRQARCSSTSAEGRHDAVNPHTNADGEISQVTFRTRDEPIEQDAAAHVLDRPPVQAIVLAKRGGS